MLIYIIKRVIYAIPILIGVNLITFMLFFMVNSPDDMARSQLGAKQVTPEMIEAWKEKRGYNRPLFINEKRDGFERFSDTLFFQESSRLFRFDFGSSDSGRDIWEDIKSRAIPSLMLAIPTLIIGLAYKIYPLAMLLVLFRDSLLDRVATVSDRDGLCRDPPPNPKPKLGARVYSPRKGALGSPTPGVGEGPKEPGGVLKPHPEETNCGGKGSPPKRVGGNIFSRGGEIRGGF